MNNDGGIQREPQYMTVDEWRELERANPDAKYEYIEGQVYLMSGEAWLILASAATL
jgi:Uma2 family endonuclease